MDKLKENGFALGLGGLGVLFLALAWFLIYQPVFGTSGIGANKKGLTSQQKTLQGLLAREILPTPEYAEKVGDREKKDLEAYESAIKGFEERCMAFRRYFDGTEDQPSISQFSSLYRDGIKTLKESYLTSHPEILEAIDEDERGDSSKVPPTVELKKDTDLEEDPENNIALAMKQFWIAQAVFRACGVDNDQVTTKLGGLKSIEFAELRERGSRKKDTKKSSDEDESSGAGYKIASAEVLADITIEMPYGEFEGFLSRLLSDSKVPFLEPKTVTMTATSLADEETSPFRKFVHKVSYSNKAALDAAVAAGEPKIAEPPVEFKIRLVALDWQGVTRQSDGANEDEDLDDLE